MKITVFYDYICPFSFIGSKRIQQIGAEYGIEVEWKGYEIHPEYSPQAKKRRQTLRAIRTAESLQSVMEEEEVKFKLPGFLTNSRLCLEAAEFSKTKGKFIEFHNLCYESYFLERRNIGDKDTVLEIGTKVGIDRDELEINLKNGEMAEILGSYRRDAQEIDVLGVPTVVFNDFRVHGVQRVETYRSIIAKFSN
ncbi:MAG: DsbA family protein [Thermodesulfobacteriota bacterium]